MKHYSAFFSDGVVRSRSSKTAFTHAWRAQFIDDTGPCDVSGFATSADLAQKAANKFRKVAKGPLKTEVVAVNV